MSTITHLFDKFFLHQFTEKRAVTTAWPKVSVKKVSEVCWGMLTFLLFLAMGPFSAIAVVLSVASLVPKGSQLEPESAR